MGDVSTCPNDTSHSRQVRLGWLETDACHNRAASSTGTVLPACYTSIMYLWGIGDPRSRTKMLPGIITVKYNMRKQILVKS